MKRNLLILGTCFILTTTGCGSGITQSDYDTMQSENQLLKDEKSKLGLENQSLKDEKTELEMEVKSLSADLYSKNNKLEDLTSEYNKYKKDMKPYEKLSVAEAEAKTAKAEQEKAAAEKRLKEQEAAEKAEQKAKEKAAAKKKAEEEAKGYETGITYNQLARTPDKYEGKKIKFKGEVLQILEGDEEIQMRLAVNGDYDTILYCAYDPSIVSSRILEDDTITIYGTSLGLYSYESSITTITIPSAYVDRIDQ